MDDKILPSDKPVIQVSKVQEDVPLQAQPVNIHKRYICVGDFGSPFGYLVDWDGYMSNPWYKRPFIRDRYVIGYGRREEISQQAQILNFKEHSEKQSKT